MLVFVFSYAIKKKDEIERVAKANRWRLRSLMQEENFVSFFVYVGIFSEKLYVDLMCDIEHMKDMASYYNHFAWFSGHIQSEWTRIC